MKRRTFIRIGATGAVGLYVSTGSGWVRTAVASEIPGGTLSPGDVAKFVLPLMKPPAMPGKSNKNKDKYTLAVRQFSQRVLSPPHPETTVWGYGSEDHPGTVAQGGTFHYPSFTIEAGWNRDVQIQWRNELTDASGAYLPHLLPVDPTLHWANPPGGFEYRDRRPTFDATPGPYTGPVPLVTHVHGAHTTEDNDGYPEAWYLPDANNIPAGYARTGTFFDYFNAKYGHGWDHGASSFKYPNDQRATTLWYHDHTLGLVRLNVYAGPAGFYLIRGGPDDVVLDNRDGTPAVLPGPAPGVGDDPLGTYHEIPIVVQDRSFNADGSLFYPDTRAFFDGYGGPYVPDSPVSPIWNPEFFGNMMVVNGFTWPYLEVQQRRYRFRLLNGCNSRFLILQFEHPGVEVWQIGADGGLLPQPVRLNDVRYPGAYGSGATVLMAPGERADVIADFTNVPVGTEVHLLNLGPDEPFGGGTIGVDFDPADPTSTGRVMQFRVRPTVGADTTTPPRYLELPARVPLGTESISRELSLNEEAYEPCDVPHAALLGTFDGEAGESTPLLWMDPVTENPDTGDVEQWKIYNLTEDAHPVHVHQVQFEVLGREAIGGGSSITGSAGPLPWETGFKDTVIAYPGEVTRIRARFDLPGLYVWHCHIAEHEDNEMMRPFRVGPVQDLVVDGTESEPLSLSSYPEPFNPTTTIRFEMPNPGNVRLEVFDVSGRRVARLVDGHMGAGIQEVPFNAGTLPSGMYFGRLTAAGHTVTHRMLLLK